MSDEELAAARGLYALAKTWGVRWPQSGSTVMPPDEHNADRAERLAEVDAWLADLEPGCDGWYIETSLVRWLRDQLTASERDGVALSDYLNLLSIENAQLRARINGTVDD